MDTVSWSHRSVSTCPICSSNVGPVPSGGLSIHLRSGVGVSAVGTHPGEGDLFLMKKD